MLCKMHNSDGSITWECVPACCRCGFCCLSEPCPVGVLAFGLAPGADLGRPRGRCPGLSFDSSGAAVCAVLAESERFSEVWAALGASSAKDRARIMGCGAGCCIKARLCKGGKEYQFARLDPELKRLVVSVQLAGVLK